MKEMDMKNKMDNRTNTGNSDPHIDESVEETVLLRPYRRPRVLSAEALEATAATCDGAGGFGKSIPIPCGTLGS